MAIEKIVFTPSRLVFIGLGGIGSWLVEPVCRYFQGTTRYAVLVDGDSIENRNLERQAFSSSEVSAYKAHAIMHRMRTLFPGWTFTAYTAYVNHGNVRSVINPGDVVFVAPDNHEARRVVALWAKRMTNIAVFTAGNELYDGSVHIYLRLAGIEMSRDFMHRHPEAAGQMIDRRDSCGAAIDRGEVQLIAVNFLMAALVLTGVHMVFQYGSAQSVDKIWGMIPQELYGSISGKVRASMVMQQALAKEAVEKEVACTS